MLKLFTINTLLLFLIMGCGGNSPTSSNGGNTTGNPNSLNGFYTVVERDGWRYGRNIIPVPSGGYIVVGWTNYKFKDRSNLYLIRVDAQGNVIWDKDFGGAESDYGDGVTLTADGNILAVGGSNSFGTEYEKYIVKVDMNGNLIWETTLSSATQNRPFKVFAVSNGYIIGGNTGVAGSDERFSVMKIDLNGNLVWDSTYTSTATSRFLDMVATDDGGFILVGDYILKINSNGVQQWIAGVSMFFGIYSVLEAADGSIVIAGDNYVSKLDSDGKMVWEYNYGGGSMWYGYAVDNNNGTFSFCNMSSISGEIYITKLDADGKLISSYGTHLIAIPHDMIKTQGGYAITGATSPDPGDVFILEVKER